MNNVSLMGRVTRDPELRYTSEKAVCRYTLAVERQGAEKVDFINIVSFGKAAEFAAKYFTKGQRVAVTGHIQTGDYTDRNGIKRYTFDIIAERQYFADAKRDAQEAVQEAAEGDEFVPDTDDDDLPF